MSDHNHDAIPSQPKLPADVNLHQCPPSSNKLQRISDPNPLGWTHTFDLSSPHPHINVPCSCKPSGKTAVRESAVDVQVLLQEEPGNDNDAAYQPLIAFQGNKSPDDSSYLSLVDLQCNISPGARSDDGYGVKETDGSGESTLQEEPGNDNDAAYQPLIAFQGNKSPEATDDSSYLSLVDLQCSISPGARSDDGYGIKEIDGSGQSTNGGYKSESGPQKARVRRTNSDLSSRGTVMRKGTIKIYKDAQDTINTQRQLSAEDFTVMDDSPPNERSSSRYSKNEGGVDPHATLKFKEDEAHPNPLLHWKMNQVNCTNSQPALADGTDTSECADDNFSSDDEDYAYVLCK